MSPEEFAALANSDRAAVLVRCGARSGCGKVAAVVLDDSSVVYNPRHRRHLTVLWAVPGTMPMVFRSEVADALSRWRPGRKSVEVVLLPTGRRRPSRAFTAARRRLRASGDWVDV